MPRKLFLRFAMIFIIIIVLWVILWEHTPHPHYTISPYEYENQDNVEISVHAEQVDLEKGIRYKYTAQNLTEQEVPGKFILAILNSASYYNTLSNLIPIFPYLSNTKGGLKSIYIAIASEHDTYTIIWTGSNIITYLINDERYIYRLVDQNAYDRLMEYIVSNIGCQTDTLGPGNMAP